MVIDAPKYFIGHMGVDTTNYFLLYVQIHWVVKFYMDLFRNCNLQENPEENLLATSPHFDDGTYCEL